MSLLSLTLKDFLRSIKLIFNSIKEKLHEEELINLKENNHFFNFNTIIITLTIYSFYMMSYFFLYGYDVKTKDSTYSLLNVLIKSTQFKFRSIMLIGGILFLILIFSFLIYQVMKKKKIKGILMFIFLHYITSCLFLGSNMINILSIRNLYKLTIFMLIWLFPLSILLFFKYMKISLEDIYSVIISFFTSVNLSIFIFLLLNNIFEDKSWFLEIRESLISFIVIFLLSILTILFNKFEKDNKSFNLFSYFSISLFLGMFINKIISENFYILTSYYYYISSLSISFIVFLLIFKFNLLELIDNFTTQKEDKETIENKICLFISHVANLSMLRIIFSLLIILSVFFIFIPETLINIGYVLRTIIEIINELKMN